MTFTNRLRKGLMIMSAAVGTQAARSQRLPQPTLPALGKNWGQIQITTLRLNQTSPVRIS